jgi:prepilin-type N-terminal cleavage/methylation domain-containing protein
VRHPRGVTLIEMLVALGIAALLAASLTGVLRGTVSVWRDMRRQSRLDQRARAVLDRLGTDLRNSLPFPGTPPEKTEDRLVLYTTAVGVPADATDRIETRFVRVTWRSSGAGEESVLERTEEPLAPTPTALPARRSAVAGRLRIRYDGTVGAALELTEGSATARYQTAFRAFDPRINEP